MGYVRHHAIIVTSFMIEHINAAHDKAMELFNVTIAGTPQPAFVTPVISSPVNRWLSFMVGPDGNNEGWESSARCDELRESFKEWLRAQVYDDGSSSLKWVEVQYGDDGGAQGVLSASNWQRHAESKEGPSGRDNRSAGRQAESATAPGSGATRLEGRDDEGASSEPAAPGGAPQDQRGGAGVGGGPGDADGGDWQPAQVVTERRKIVKHVLTPGSNLVALAAGAELLDVGCYGGQLCLWAFEVKASDLRQHFRRFEVLPTGMWVDVTIKEGECSHRHVGTAVIKDGTLACHVFEVPA